MRVGMLIGALVMLAAARPVAAIERPLADVPPAPKPASQTNIGPGSKLTFAHACAPGNRVTIAGVGDLLFHADLEKEALTPTGSYRDFWKPVEPVLKGADLTYGNFEGTSAEGITTRLEFVKDPGKAWNNRVYSAPPYQLLFNYHPSVAGDLKSSGFDVVSTANTHSLDRGPIGIDRTIANLEKGGLAVTGTRPRDDLSHPFSTVTRVKGLNVAWLACTYYTNGFIDQHSQVLYCFEQKDMVLREIRRLAASPGIDAVILTPHWGLEGSPTPEPRARELAQEALDAGATAIIGTHPHVLQPWEKMTAKDGREGLVIYSTGNFISAQHRPEQRLGAIVLLELLKEPDAAKARVSAAGYVSSWVVTEGPHRVIEAPRDMPSRFLPVGNRVMAADLPKLPRDCGAGEQVAASWGNEAAVTVAMLPFPVASNRLAEARTGAAVRDEPPIAAGTPLVAVVAAPAAQPASAAPAKPSLGIRFAALPAIRSPHIPAGLAVPVSLVRQIEIASPVIRRFALALPPELPAPGRLSAARLIRELTALRDHVGPGLPLAVAAEINKAVASDRAARAPVSVAATGKPRRKDIAIIKALGATSQSFVSKKN